MAKLNSNTIQDVTNKMSVGVASTTNDKNYFEETYQWSPQLDSTDIFGEIVPKAANQMEANLNVSNNPMMISKITEYVLDELPATNGQGYSCFAVPGDKTSERLKRFLTPQKFGNGYAFTLKNTNGDVIPLTAGAYQFDYNNGILRFNEGNTPSDEGWALPLKLTAYRYIGVTLGTAGSSSASYRQPARLLDRSSTVLTGWSSDPTIDEVQVVDGDIVLFTNLTDPNENNRKYAWDNSANLWTIIEDGKNEDGAPTDADQLVIQEGTFAQDNIYLFNGTEWVDTGKSNLIVSEEGGVPLGNNVAKIVLCSEESNHVYIDGTTAYLHAPPAPLALDTTNSISTHSGRISQDNINYKAADPAGSSIDYIVRAADIPSNFTITTIPASFSNASLGLLKLSINGIDVATLDLESNFNEANRKTGQIMADYDITGNGDTVVDGVVTFSNGTLVLNSVATDTSIIANPYQKGSCTVNITDPAAFRQGYNTIQLSRDSDVSTLIGIFYDTHTGDNPIIISSDLKVDVPVITKISGVPFYNKDSTFNYDTEVENAFDNVYHSSNAPIQVSGFPGTSIAGIEYSNAVCTGVTTPPKLGETLTVTNYKFTVTESYADKDVKITVTPRDPYGSYVSNISASKGISINSLPQSSTEVLENFVDENYRFPSTTNFDVVPSGLTGNWNSDTSLSAFSNELQVYDEDEADSKCLSHPSESYNIDRLPLGPDYSSLAANTDYLYVRVFKASTDKSNGIIDIPGISDANLADTNFTFEIKVPTKTDWMNAGLDYNLSSFEDNVKFVNTPWTASAAASSGTWVIPTTPNGFKYKCTTGGTTGGSEPTWATSVNGTTNDGDVVWNCYKIDNGEGCRINPTSHTPNKDSSIQFTLGSYAADISVNRCIFVRITMQSNAYSGLLKSGYGIGDW